MLHYTRVWPQPSQQQQQQARISWVDSPRERLAAAWALSLTFVVAFLLIVASGAVVLASTRDADDAFEGLDGRDVDARCLRLGRRADHAVVFVGLGSPVQYLKLLLRLDEVGEPSVSMRVHSERMHKSLSMRCTPLDPPVPFTEACHDSALVYRGTNRLERVIVPFLYQNYLIEESQYERSTMLGLDGSLALTHNTTYWLTTTHLCFVPHEPETAVSPDFLTFATDSDGLSHTTFEELRGFEPTRLAPAAAADRDGCENVTHGESGVRLFPVDAAVEAQTWLSLAGDFLYEYGNDILEQRREVVEVGSLCASNRTELEHVNDLYRLDCDIHYPSWCQTTPALPYRRLAQHRIRLDVASDGTGTLRAEETQSLARIPYLQSYSESLVSAFGRLLVMVLTAAVVFVRGSQNASSSKYMLEFIIATVRCRKPENPWSINHSLLEVAVDFSISLVALGSRIVVLAFSWKVFEADGVGAVLPFEVAGVAASVAHLVMRYAILSWDLAREAPLTKLAGPMSIVDVSSAVLMAFSDAPLLSSDDGRFAAVGRLLISLLISISVFTRCAFAAAMCALLAATVTNDAVAYRKSYYGYQFILVVATVLWAVQGVVSSVSLSLLFVQPASYVVTRLIVGDTSVFRYCLYFGLTMACLPTMTKISLRVLESECNADDVKKGT